MVRGTYRKRIVASIFARALGQFFVGAVLGIASVATLKSASGENLLGGNTAAGPPVVAPVLMGVGFLAARGAARRGPRIEPAGALGKQ